MNGTGARLAHGVKRPHCERAGESAQGQQPRAVLTKRIWIGDTPPSLNVVAGRRWQWTKAKRRWQTDLGVLLMAEQLPRGLHRVEASAVLTFPTRRRRDEGNFRALLEKALGDALVEGGWLDDDTPDHFSFGAVTFALGAARTTVEVTAYPKEHR